MRTLKSLLYPTLLQPIMALTLFISTINSHAANSHAQIPSDMTLDVAHFWVSQSESEALDVFRNSWTNNGNRWIDMPNKDKIATQRVVSERIVNGYPPAVMQWNANEGSRELPKMGIVIDIDQVAKEDKWHEILPKSVLDRISYQDKIYFAPTNIHAENWLWSSQTIFDQLGLDIPVTWDDILLSAKKMQSAGYLPIALGGGTWEVSLIFNNILHDQLGSEGYADIISGNADIVMDSRMLKALTILRQVSQYTAPLDKRANQNWADATDLVGQGKAGMQFMGDWAKGELYARGYLLDQDFNCSLVPGTEISYFMVIDAFAFPITNREGAPQAQKAFARTLMNQENQIAFSKAKGSLPVRMDVDPSGLDHCGRLGLKMLIEQNRGISAQSMAMPSEISEGWINVLNHFFNDESISAEEAQQQLYQTLNQR